MAKKYLPQRAKVLMFIEQYIIPTIKKRDLDYYEVVKGLSQELQTSEKIIKECLQQQIESGKIKEHRVLTISDNEISSFLEKLRKDNELVNDEIDEVFDGSK